MHIALHGTPPWKHSQYFFRHMDFLQRQPFLWAMLVIAVKLLVIAADVGRYFESNALGLRSKIRLTATSRTAALSGRFSHDTHLQVELQVALAAKH